MRRGATGRRGQRALVIGAEELAEGARDVAEGARNLHLRPQPTRQRVDVLRLPEACVAEDDGAVVVGVPYDPPHALIDGPCGLLGGRAGGAWAVEGRIQKRLRAGHCLRTPPPKFGALVSRDQLTDRPTDRPTSEKVPSGKKNPKQIQNWKPISGIHFFFVSDPPPTA